jgi:hypothetical protein
MSSLIVLLAANVIALAIAWRYGMGLRDLMIVYWIQSIIIGLATIVRIVAIGWLEYRQIPKRDWFLRENPFFARAGEALFFTFHWGLFHLVYLVFIFMLIPGQAGSMQAYQACALVFLLNHGYSLWQNLRRDVENRPRSLTVAALPYARVVPMHVTIIFGTMYFSATGKFFLFAGLKILADVAMHVLEHAVLRRPRKPAPTRLT